MLATQPFAAQLRDNLIHRVNVGDSLTRTAARYPDRLAVVDGDRRLTYAEFNAWVNRVAHGLTARGYGRGGVRPRPLRGAGAGGGEPTGPGHGRRAGRHSGRHRGDHTPRYGRRGRPRVVGRPGGARLRRARR